MKFKALTIIVVSSLLAASLAYAVPDATPSFADDTAMPDRDNSAPADQPPAQNDNNNPNATNNSSDATPPADMGGNTTPGTANNNDDMSADTATGDDDY